MVLNSDFEELAGRHFQAFSNFKFTRWINTVIRSIKDEETFAMGPGNVDEGSCSVIEGDILVDLRPKEEESGDARDVVDRRAARRWPKGFIPYVISEKVKNDGELFGNVCRAISEWGSRTGGVLTFADLTHEFEFADGTSKNKLPDDYVKFIMGYGCSSFVGRIGGRQIIKLCEGCPYGTVLHEIGHTIGLYHTNARGDRDNFIEVLEENVEDGMPHCRHQFECQVQDGIDILGYGYDSIMHYAADAFGRAENGRKAVTIKTRGGQPIGQRKYLSFGDVAAVRQMYGSDDDCICYSTLKVGSKTIRVEMLKSRNLRLIKKADDREIRREVIPCNSIVKSVPTFEYHSTKDSTVIFVIAGEASRDVLQFKKQQSGEWSSTCIATSTVSLVGQLNFARWDSNGHAVLFSTTADGGVAKIANGSVTDMGGPPLNYGRLLCTPYSMRCLYRSDQPEHHIFLIGEGGRLLLLHAVDSVGVEGGSSCCSIRWTDLGFPHKSCGRTEPVTRLGSLKVDWKAGVFTVKVMSDIEPGSEYLYEVTGDTLLWKLLTDLKLNEEAMIDDLSVNFNFHRLKFKHARTRFSGLWYPDGLMERRIEDGHDKFDGTDVENQRCGFFSTRHCLKAFALKQNNPVAVTVKTRESQLIFDTTNSNYWREFDFDRLSKAASQRLSKADEIRFLLFADGSERIDAGRRTSILSEPQLSSLKTLRGDVISSSSIGFPPVFVYDPTNHFTAMFVVAGESSQDVLQITEQPSGELSSARIATSSVALMGTLDFVRRDSNGYAVLFATTAVGGIAKIANREVSILGRPPPGYGKLLRSPRNMMSVCCSDKTEYHIFLIAEGGRLLHLNYVDSSEDEGASGGSRISWSDIGFPHKVSGRENQIAGIAGLTADWNRQMFTIFTVEAPDYITPHLKVTYYFDHYPSKIIVIVDQVTIESTVIVRPDQTEKKRALDRSLRQELKLRREQGQTGLRIYTLKYTMNDIR